MLGWMNRKLESRLPGEISMISDISDMQMIQVVKNPLANAGDLKDKGSIPGLGRFPREGFCNPLQYFCLENPKDRGTRWAPSPQGSKDVA